VHFILVYIRIHKFTQVYSSLHIFIQVYTITIYADWIHCSIFIVDKVTQNSRSCRGGSFPKQKSSNHAAYGAKLMTRVSTFKLLKVETVFTFKLLMVDTVSTFNLLKVDTVSTFNWLKVETVSTFKHFLYLH
jgi:hypothetical protein